MTKILLIGKTDSSYTELGDKLSDRYSVKYGSSGGFAAEAFLKSYAPSLVVIRAAATDKEIIEHIRKYYPALPSVVLGSPDEAAALSELHPIAVCADDVRTAFDTICAAVPDTGGSESRMTVMVIDDDAGTLRMINTMLSGEFDMILATSGSRAIIMLEKKRPDVILLDYEMPEMNGTETLDAIRAFKEYADIPVIFLTGTDAPEVLEKIGDADISGYLTKPADMQDIKDAVRKAAKGNSETNTAGKP